MNNYYLNIIIGIILTQNTRLYIMYCEYAYMFIYITTLNNRRILYHRNNIK